MKILPLVAALTFLPTSFLLAQTAAAPERAALLENEQIRVRELRLPPGAKTRAEPRPNTFLYALTDGALVFSPPGRTAYELSFKAGEALWLPAQETATSNEGDKEVRVLTVEVKARPPVSKRRGGKARKGGKKAATPKS